MVERLFLAVPRGCLWFVIVVFPDHTHLLFLKIILIIKLKIILANTGLISFEMTDLASCAFQPSDMK